MKFLGITNYKLICKVIQDFYSKKNNNKNYKLIIQDQLFIYQAMKYIKFKNFNLNLTELNKKTISFLIKFLHDNKIKNPIEKLPINNDIKKSLTISINRSTIINRFFN